MFPFLRYNVFSFAFTKSSCVTLILRSLSASRPASVHTALMSAPVIMKDKVEDLEGMISRDNESENEREGIKE
jgi:hypothetical protein